MNNLATATAYKLGALYDAVDSASAFSDPIEYQDSYVLLVINHNHNRDKIKKAISSLISHINQNPDCVFIGAVLKSGYYDNSVSMCIEFISDIEPEESQKLIEIEKYLKELKSVGSMG